MILASMMILLRARTLTFALSLAEQLDCHDGVFDHVVCQQGFQFFSGRKASSREIYLVLKGGGSRSGIFSGLFAIRLRHLELE